MAIPSIVFVLTAALALLAKVASAQNSYCNIQTCNGPDHTLCKYAYLQTDSRCGKVQSSTLTATEIQQILDTHNMHRAFVASGQETRGNPGPQPAATNLGPLKWDDEIAGVAQTWADQCNYGHDKCRDVQRFGVGQNIIWTGTNGNYNSNFPELVTGWYSEVAKFDRNQVKSVNKDFENVGHYTQMMWAGSTLLGCGAVRYNSDGQWNATYLVCNYGPAGNVIGGEMYKTL